MIEETLDAGELWMLEHKDKVITQCPKCHVLGWFPGSFCSDCYSEMATGYRSVECLKETYGDIH